MLARLDDDTQSKPNFIVTSRKPGITLHSPEPQKTALTVTDPIVSLK